MSRIMYVNGRYLPRSEATIPIEDRGYLFADGVYDAFELRNGQIIDIAGHLGRLYHSMSEIAIDNPPAAQVMEHILRETVRRNRYPNGFIYLQVTRGVAPRDFAFPAPDTPVSIVCIVYNAISGALDRLAQEGISVITCRDIRWKRPDIKTLLLLPAVLAKQAASEQGAKEAWMVDDEGYITEGSASNAWIITRENELITRKADGAILRGITRTAIFEFLEREKLTLVERSFTLEEALGASEAFISACSLTVMPVVKIDGTPIGTGKPGAKTLSMREIYRDRSFGIIM